MAQGQASDGSGGHVSLIKREAHAIDELSPIRDLQGE